MGNITKLNDILCYDINAIDGTVASDIVKWDANEFCVSPTPTPTPTQSPVTPTPTPTITPTPTPTPPCVEDCCLVELCYGKEDCSKSCACNEIAMYYLHLPCGGQCWFPNASGIYTDDLCTSAADAGYYTDQNLGECWYWDGSSSLTYNADC